MAYFLIGLIWMWLLEPLASLFVADTKPSERTHALIHAIFIFASSLLLYLLIRRSNREANRSEQRLWTLLDNLPVMFNSFAADGRTIIFWNKECERITGYSRKEIVGNTDALKLLYPDQAYLEAMMAKTRIDRLGQYEPNWAITTRSGQERIIFWPDTTELFKDTPDLGFWGVGIDVTDRETAIQERERLLREVGAFAHTVAHDLKNPLDIALTYAHLLSGNEIMLSPDERDMAVTAIQNSVIKMNNIIDELLLLASVDHPPVEFRALDTAMLVQEAIDRLAFMPEMKKAIIVLPQTEWPVAIGYPQWVEEVWVNYISNALKYGGNPPHIELGSDAHAGGKVRFWLRDNGPGLSPEQRDQLFQPFTRIEEMRPRATGHGLGLSIVRRIVERLGGEIGYESSPGQGSTFYFTLPSDTGK